MTTDEAREALVDAIGATPQRFMIAMADLEDAIRAEYKHWHTVAEYEAKLAALREAVAFLMSCVASGEQLTDDDRARLRAALDATKAER